MGVINKMTRNYYLCCREIKEYIWIGQGEYQNAGLMQIYSGEDKIMKDLGKFLNKTKGKELILKDEHDDEIYNGYKEFKNE